MINRKSSPSPWNLELPPIFGAAIRLNVTFLLVPLWICFVFYSDTSSLLGAPVLFVAIVASLFIHEAAHAIAAALLHSPVRSLCIFPFGAATNISSELSPNARVTDELIVRVAGPFATIGIMNVVSFLLSTQTGTPAAMLEELYRLNGILLLFSLLPIFPLDMYPVMRRALRNTKDPIKFTFSIGQWLAIFILAAAIFQGDEVVCVYAATLLLLTIREQVYQRAYAMARKLCVKDVMSKKEELYLLPHGDQVKKNMEAIVRCYQPFIPVLHGDRFVGVVARDNALELLADGEDHYISEAFDKEPIIIHQTDSVADVYELLANEQREYAVVLKKEEFVGLVTKEKISEFLVINHLIERAKHQGSPVDHEL